MQNCKTSSTFAIMATPSLHLEERFRHIYFANKDRLYHFVRKYTKDPASVEDLVQECFISIWHHLEEVHDDETIFPLLRTYAHNIVINHNRREARRLLRDAACSNGLPLVTDTAEDELHMKETWRSFHDTINQFPEKRRKIYLLKKQHGYTHREIAEHLKISIKAIEKHMSEANQVLREKFTTDKLAVICILLTIENWPVA